MIFKIIDKKVAMLALFAFFGIFLLLVGTATIDCFTEDWVTVAVPITMATVLLLPFICGIIVGIYSMEKYIIDSLLKESTDTNYIVTCEVEDDIPRSKQEQLRLPGM